MGVIDPDKQFRGGSQKGRKVSRKPNVLRDMRTVYEGREPEGGWTAGQVTLKKLFEAEPEKFIDRLLRAERDHAAGRAKVSAGEQTAAPPEKVPAVVVVDEGSARADAVLREWQRTYRDYPVPG